MAIHAALVDHRLAGHPVAELPRRRQHHARIAPAAEIEPPRPVPENARHMAAHPGHDVRNQRLGLRLRQKRRGVDLRPGPDPLRFPVPEIEPMVRQKPRHALIGRQAEGQEPAPRGEIEKRRHLGARRQRLQRVDQRRRRGDDPAIRVEDRRQQATCVETEKVPPAVPPETDEPAPEIGQRVRLEIRARAQPQRRLHAERPRPVEGPADQNSDRRPVRRLDPDARNAGSRVDPPVADDVALRAGDAGRIGPGDDELLGKVREIEAHDPSGQPENGASRRRVRKR